MKIYLKNQDNFSKEAFEFYQNNFELVPEQEADLIVVNDFEPVKSDKIVACNATCCDHIKAKEVVSLQGEDLSDLTAVAELCLGMVIYLTRIFKGEEIMGKTLGIIGYGRIGKKFADYASKVGMNVLVFDEDIKERIGDKYDIKEILSLSDIISLHITASEENRNFIKKEHFEKMKDGAIFLNSARPWLVEEEGLKWALDNKLAGAWYDFDMPFEHKNLVTTPHWGGSTKESRAKSELVLANKLLRLYGGK